MTINKRHKILDFFEKYIIHRQSEGFTYGFLCHAFGGNNHIPEWGVNLDFTLDDTIEVVEELRAFGYEYIPCFKKVGDFWTAFIYEREPQYYSLNVYNSLEDRKNHVQSFRAYLRHDFLSDGKFIDEHF